jgi:hypothetical protein
MYPAVICLAVMYPVVDSSDMQSLLQPSVCSKQEHLPISAVQQNALVHFLGTARRGKITHTVTRRRLQRCQAPIH